MKRTAADEARDLPSIAARRRVLENELADVNRSLHGSGEEPLANLRIAAPCEANWDDMMGDEVTRFCGGCQHNVTNISAMTRDEAAAFVASSKDACIRLYRRHDGTVVHDDCTVGVKRRRVRLAIVSVIGAGAAAVTAAAMAPPCESIDTVPSVGRGATARDKADTTLRPVHDGPTVRMGRMPMRIEKQTK